MRKRLHVLYYCKLHSFIPRNRFNATIKLSVVCGRKLVQTPYSYINSREYIIPPEYKSRSYPNKTYNKKRAWL